MVINIDGKKAIWSHPREEWLHLIGYLQPPVAGHASWCWHSELGAGMPYNREKTHVYFASLPRATIFFF